MACQGDKQSRTEITALVTPMIQFQTDKFCRRFCQHAYLQTQCTLTPPMRSSNTLSQNTPLCDKANASYTWMLDDLTKEKRLLNIRAKNKIQLIAYFKTLINSLPFYERWKNWRFERRVHVPDYIAAISRYATQIFLLLQSNHSIPLAAQKLGLAEIVVAEDADKIIVELTRRKRLHLLNPSKTVKFSDLQKVDNDSGEAINFEIEDDKFSPERLVLNEQIKNIWQTLSDVEQFVIEALVIENQDAKHVLSALTEMGISLKKSQDPEENNQQQLYYFKRKALEKLSAKLKQD